MDESKIIKDSQFLTVLTRDGMWFSYILFVILAWRGLRIGFLSSE